MNKENIRYYKDFDTDFYENTADYKLPESYKWIRKDIISKILSVLIYTAALIFSNIYCRFFLHIKIKGAKKVRSEKSGFFFYGNHTQPIGDVFNPALACFPKRIYTVVSPANFALPIIGKILPFLGALPVSDTLRGMKELNQALKYRIERKHPIIIYPEAHVWEYYTDIRPFPEVSFKYPIKFGVPAYCFTTTYQKRRFGKKPAAVIYVDGPFFPDSSENKHKAAQELRDKILSKMKERSQKSDCEYIKYMHIGKEDN